MLRLFYLSVLVNVCSVVAAQELYVFTNPASNIPAKAIAAKLGIKTMRPYHAASGREFRLMPEVQVGITKELMLSGAVSFSNMFFQDAISFESARLYAKYRFYSNDDVHKHFRAAAFAAGSWSNNPLVYQELNLEGDNSGVQAGLLATQLVNKFAATAGVSYIRQLEKNNKLFFGPAFSNEGIQYNLSMGYLLFPRNYKSYNQTNFNLYCEFIGFKNTDVNKSFLDIAPAVQFIFKSSTRLNLGGRYQVTGNAHRMANQSFFVSLEHYFLNALK
ncbi:MAG: hypothetical protein K2Q24_14170 [Chitinophagaceae bacterium]|jgi:hypothetical protein|nr:hypothetical protein [Chitinophagaceae bacterium]